MNSFIDNFFDNLILGYNVDSKKDYKIKEEDGKIKILILAPGAKQEDVSIEEKENSLSVAIKSEIWGEKKLSFSLAKTVDTNPDNISAKLENGVLEITLTEKEDSKPKKIEIKTA